MGPVALFSICTLLCVAVVGTWWWEDRRHRARLDRLPIRVHVNGTRGKSSVTRLIAAALRGAGVPTVAKTTGSAAALIPTDGVDIPIRRLGQPTILEQLNVFRRAVESGAEAVVIECMALDPGNQVVSEERMVRSTIGVLTNVREDHQDVMGHTLEEIADSMLSTCPRDGVLVTAERNPALVERLGAEAARRGSRLIAARPERVSAEELARFQHVAFAENVSIALEISSLLGIDREVALASMVASDPDPGALRYVQREVLGKRVTWVNLFAINDSESVIEVARRSLREHGGEGSTTVGILNNRLDREMRARQFADIAALDLEFDRLALIGAYERSVRAQLLEGGYDEDRILLLGEQRHIDLDAMLDQLVGDAPTSHVVLVGMVNIHSRQAEQLLEFFEDRVP